MKKIDRGGEKKNRRGVNNKTSAQQRNETNELYRGRS